MKQTLNAATLVAGLTLGVAPSVAADDWTAVYGGVGVGAGAIVHELNLAVPPLAGANLNFDGIGGCLLYTSPSPRDRQKSRMPSSA